MARGFFARKESCRIGVRPLVARSGVALDKVKAEAIARARAQIAERISGFCKNLTAEEMDALLDRMAGVQCKYDTIASSMPPETPPRPRELD